MSGLLVRAHHHVDGNLLRTAGSPYEMLAPLDCALFERAGRDRARYEELRALRRAYAKIGGHTRVKRAVLGLWGMLGALCEELAP